VPTTFYPLAACLANALERQTALVNSVCHLYQEGLAANPSTPLADYTTAEADFSGYEEITFAAWGAPILAPQPGYMIASPLAQFMFDSGEGEVGNNIQGVYLVSAAAALRMAVVFDELIPVEQDGQGVLFYLIMFLGVEETVS